MRSSYARTCEIPPLRVRDRLRHRCDAPNVRVRPAERAPACRIAHIQAVLPLSPSLSVPNQVAVIPPLRRTLQTSDFRLYTSLNWDRAVPQADTFSAGPPFFAT